MSFNTCVKQKIKFSRLAQTHGIVENVGIANYNFRLDSELLHQHGLQQYYQRYYREKSKTDLY